MVYIKVTKPEERTKRITNKVSLTTTNDQFPNLNTLGGVEVEGGVWRWGRGLGVEMGKGGGCGDGEGGWGRSVVRS